MKLLVTGGAGFIGSYLVERLITHNEVTVLDNFHRASSRASAGGKRHLTVQRDDIRDLRVVTAAMRGAEVVYHLAAQSRVAEAVQDPQYCRSTNVTGTANVVRAALDLGVRRLVFASSREVYGEPATLPVAESAPVQPKNIYGASKAEGEDVCLKAASRGLEVVILRFTNIYGIGDADRVIPNFVSQAFCHEPIRIFGGEKVLDFLPVEAAVQALLAAEATPLTGTPINVGSGAGTSLRDLAKRIVQLTSSRSDVRECAVRKQEVTRFVADIARASEALGFQAWPKDPLCELPALVEHIERTAHAVAAC